MSFILKNKSLVDTLVSVGEEFNAKYVTAQQQPTEDNSLPDREDAVAARKELAKKLVKNLQTANIQGAPAAATSATPTTPAPGAPAAPGAHSTLDPATNKQPAGTSTNAPAGTPAAVKPDVKSTIDKINFFMSKIPVEAEPRLTSIYAFLQGASILLEQPDVVSTWINEAGIQNADANIITGGTLANEVNEIRRLYVNVAARVGMNALSTRDFANPTAFRNLLHTPSGRAPTWREALEAVDQMTALFDKTVDAYRQVVSKQYADFQESTYSNLEGRLARLRQAIQAQLDNHPLG